MPEVWGGVPRRNTRFTGRELVLNDAYRWVDAESRVTCRRVPAELAPKLDLSTGDEYGERLRAVRDPLRWGTPFSSPPATPSGGSTTASCSRYASTAELSRVTVVRATETLGRTHPLTLSARVAYAADLRGLRARQQAEKAEQEALSDLEAALGKQHVHTLSARARNRPYRDFEPQAS